MSMGGLPHNPYAPPGAEPEVARRSPGSYALASRSARLSGAIADGLFATVLGFAPAVAIHAAGYDPFPTKLPAGSTASWMPSGILSTLVSLVPTVYQWWLITQSGQTVGKKFMKTRIITLDGDVAGFTRGVLLRNVPLHLLGFVSTIVTTYAPSLRAVVWIVSGLSTLDDLFIFGESKRCLHDYIAGTVVVSEEPPSNARAV